MAALLPNLKYQDSRLNTLVLKRRELVYRLSRLGVSEEESEAQAGIIMEHVSGLKHAEQLVADDHTLDANALSWIDTIMAKRALHVPLQYCLGEAEFGGLSLYVEAGVLIPRPDTETVVENLAARLKKNATPPALIAEIGVGAGPITISLLKNFPQLKVWACDPSSKAIALTEKNAQRHGVDDRLTLVLGDWKDVLPENFDAIVSNPPYIPVAKKSTLPIEIVEFEPAQALFVDDEDGLTFIRSFAEKLPLHLKKTGGTIAVELGDGQAQGAQQALSNAGWKDIEVANDTHNLPRVILANFIGPR